MQILKMSFTMKTCNKCNQLKNISEYNKHPSSKDGLSGKCRECSKAYAKQHYKTNAPTIKEKSKDRRLTLKEKIAILMLNYFQSGCILCNDKTICHLELRSKLDVNDYKIYDDINNCLSFSYYEKEIEKYNIYCGNCAYSNSTKDTGKYL